MHSSRLRAAPPPRDDTPMTALAGRVAIVTGAGRRVGRALAVALGARGMRVVVHYAGSADGARETARLIQAAGGAATIVQADLRDVKAAEGLIDGVVEREGELFALVNSAAVMVRTPVGETTQAQ